MPTPREKLIEELKDKIGAAGTGFVHSTVEVIADVMIEDRKRICAPLVKYNKKQKPYPYWIQAIDETLSLALLDKE